MVCFKSTGKLKQNGPNSERLLKISNYCLSLQSRKTSSSCHKYANVTILREMIVAPPKLQSMASGLTYENPTNVQSSHMMWESSHFHQHTQVSLGFECNKLKYNFTLTLFSGQLQTISYKCPLSLMDKNKPLKTEQFTNFNIQGFSKPSV